MLPLPRPKQPCLSTAIINSESSMVFTIYENNFFLQNTLENTQSCLIHFQEGFSQL